MRGRLRIKWFRSQLEILKRCVFLNYAGTSPILKTVRKTMCNSLSERANDPNYSTKTWNMQEPIREEVAKLVGAKCEEIAFTPNVSFAITSIALALKSLGMKRVACISYDFPSVTIPWKAVGWKVYYSSTHSSEEVVKTFKNNKCEVVSVSHVNYLTGEKLNLKKLVEEVHKYGGYVLVDCYQSLGITKLNTKRLELDFLAFGFGKWLLGPVIGVLYVNRSLIEKLTPPTISWLSMKSPLSFDARNIELDDTAKRFETASLDFTLKVGAYTAAKTFNTINPKLSESRVVELTNKVIEELEKLHYKVLTPKTPEDRLGIVSFKVKNSNEYVKKLMRRGVIAASRRGNVRLSIHFFTESVELEKLFSILKSLK